MKKPNKIVYPGSNRLGQPLTQKDIRNKREAFNNAIMEFTNMDYSNLEEIEKSNSKSSNEVPVYYQNGKKLSGAKFIAFQQVLLKRKYQIKNEESTASN